MHAEQLQEVLQSCKRQAHTVTLVSLQFVLAHAIRSTLNTILANFVASTALVDMLASKVRAQIPVVRQRSIVHMRKRAVCTCHLSSVKVWKPRQALSALAALMLSVQSYTAQASPFAPGLQAGSLSLFVHYCVFVLITVCLPVLLTPQTAQQV